MPGPRAYEWRPAQANARAKMIALSLELGEIRERLMSQPGSTLNPAKAT